MSRSEWMLSSSVIILEPYFSTSQEKLSVNSSNSSVLLFEVAIVIRAEKGKVSNKIYFL